MNSSARPASSSVSTPALTVPTPAATAQYPPVAAAPTPRPAPHQPAADEDETDAQVKRDFYAWCAGCEGFGSIF